MAAGAPTLHHAAPSGCGQNGSKTLRLRARPSSSSPVLVRGSMVSPRSRSLMVDCPHAHSRAISGCVRPESISARMIDGHEIGSMRRRISNKRSGRKREDDIDIP